MLDHFEQRQDCNGKLLTIDVSIAGHLAFRCASDPRVKAAASFYAADIREGTLGSAGDDSLARTVDISGELSMAWGPSRSAHPDKGHARIQTRLLQTGRDFTWHEFNAAHAFLRDDGPRYVPALGHIVRGRRPRDAVSVARSSRRVINF